MGPKIRRQRRRLGLTLNELAGRAGISKPYLSLIETGQVPNPPSDEKLLRLEQSLGFAAGELLILAHLLRTPADVRAVLQRLLQNSAAAQPPAAGGTATVQDAFLAGFMHELSAMQATGGSGETGQNHSTDGGEGFPARRDQGSGFRKGKNCRSVAFSAP
jgi:transcriptional regulator with XRE-family HTH domain